MRIANHGYKAQSAMEYLMTYGWALLIIAVVLVALFSLGVFNSANLGPRANAGACQVVRNVESVTLQGQCQGELPRYVANFQGNSNVDVVPGQLPNGQSPRTMTAWVYPTAAPSSYNNLGIFYYGGNNCNPDGAVFGLILQKGSLYFWGSCSDVPTNFSIPQDTWSFVAVTYNSPTLGIAYNNKMQYYSASIDTCNSITCTSAYIGGNSNWWGDTFSGQLANVQIYNASLSANEVEQLYLEGIGGAPIDPLHIVGWWPLNGNAQDYSGNGNHGNSTEVSYTSAWTSGYTMP